MWLSAASYAAPINNGQNTQEGAVGGDVTSETVLTLDQADDGVALATAQGNSVTGDYYDETAFANQQSMAADTRARAQANATNIYGGLNSSGVAQANSASLIHEGALDMTSDQTASGSTVEAIALLRLDNGDPDAYTGDLTTVAQGTANALETNGYGPQSVTARQSSSASVRAEARSDVNSVNSRTASASAVSAGNSQSARTYGGEAHIGVDQTNSGAITSVSDVDHEGDAIWGATSSAQSVGNTAQVLNDDGAIRIDGAQINTGGVSASASLSVYGHDEGLALGSSNAVGNTALASALGGSVYSGVTQTNSGDVSATTLVNAGAGKGVVASATAMGNAQSAYICSACVTANSGTINQINSGAISARTQVTTQGYNPYVTGSAIAVGNAATFSSRDPGGH